jgi:hypothetical protein
MNDILNLYGFSYLPRQDNNYNGVIKDYEFYISMDNVNWTKVASGSWQKSFDKKEVYFSSSAQARYLKLVSLSEVNGSVFASGAELSVTTQLPVSSTPKAPQFVQGGRLTDTEIEIIWLDMSNDEDGFVVEQLIDENFTPVYTSASDATTFELQNTNTSTSYSFRVASFNNVGNSEYSEILTIKAIGTPVGIDDEFANGKDFAVYPNPFTNELKITSGDSGNYFRWQIFDMSGKLMKNGTFNSYTNLETINVQELKTGNYLIRLEGESGTVSKTVVKK